MMYRSNSTSKTTSKANRGFSLIELMVVMAIMSVLMGLTGGLVVKTVAQQERQVELEKVRQLFKQLSYQAFYQGSAVKVAFKGNEIQIERAGSQQILQFKQLVFVAQDYQVSTNAVVSPVTFSVFWNEGIRHFDIESIFTPIELVNDDA